MKPTPTLAAVLLLSSTPVVAAPAPSSVTIPIKAFMFMPMEITVPVGGTVTWKNLDGEPHTVVAIDGSFRSAALDEGDSFSFKFTKAGTYAYLCSVHPQMRARIVVR